MTIQNEGAILIVSGPSGCGKSTLLNEVYKNIDDYYFSISTTTRAPRDGEIDGVHYYFVSKEKFEQEIKEGKFLEYAKVHENYYGTSIVPVLEFLNEGKLVIFDIDVQGHRIIQEKLTSIVTSVFITTPSLSELEKRLNERMSDTKGVISKRIQNAKEEIASFLEYDYLIINDDIKKASKELLSIANASRIKSSISSNEIITKWLRD